MFPSLFPKKRKYESLAVKVTPLYINSFSSFHKLRITSHALKVSKYEVFSRLYFPVFSLNTGKCRPEKAPSVDTFHAVSVIVFFF